MQIDGTAEATGNDGLSEQDAAERIASLLEPKAATGDGSETRKERKAQPEAPEPDEDEPEADEAEEEAPEEESEETDEPEEDQEQPQTFTVKIDGQDVSVTLDELQRGYSRTQDYTRKTMELAEARKALEPEAKALRQEREQYATLLPKLEAHIQQQWESPDLQELRHTNPAEYLLRREELQQQINAVAAERQRVEDAQRQEEERETAERRKSEAAELLKAVPEFNDPRKYEETVGYALELGFTPEELRETDNHRAYVVLWKAQQYDRLKAKEPQTKAKVAAVKTAAPGAKATQPSKVTELTRSKQRLAKTGRVEDAAAAIERMLG